MGSKQIEIRVATTTAEEFIDVTSQVQGAVERLGIEDGTLVVFCPHTTAGMTINESADPDVRRDILSTLRSLVPSDGDYRHAEGNSPAHVKASLIGSSVMVRVEGGSLRLGTWQGIYLGEFDGPRNRRIWVWPI